MTASQNSKRLVIIGSGPAGWTAAIYAARAGLSPMVIEGLAPGGQLTITTDVENFPGFPAGIQGPQLMEEMRRQAARFGSEIVTGEVVSVDFSDNPKLLRLDDGQEVHARAVIIATGAKAKWLGIPGEQEFMGRGVSGCATCDGFFFRGQNVAVVGGGNVAVEEAIHLAGLANSVTLIHRRDKLRCERILQDRLFSLPNIRYEWNRAVHEVLGDETGLTAIELKNTETGELTTHAMDGLFVAIGHDPATGFLGDELDRLPSGHLRTGAQLVDTNVPGVFAAGDVMDPLWRQAVTSAGFGCMAALAAEKYLAGH